MINSHLKFAIERNFQIKKGHVFFKVVSKAQLLRLKSVLPYNERYFVRVNGKLNLLVVWVLSHLLLSVVSGRLLFPFTATLSPSMCWNKARATEINAPVIHNYGQIRAERSRSPKTSIPHIKYAKKKPEQACEYHTSLSRFPFINPEYVM